VFGRTRRQLAAWNAIVLGIILLLVSGTTYVMLARGLTTSIDGNLSARGEQAARSRHEFTEQALQLGRDGYQSGLFYLLAAPSGQLLANPQGVHLTALPLSVVAAPLPRYSTITLNGEPLRLYARPLPDQSTGSTLLVVGQSLELPEQTMHQQALILFAMVGGGLLLALAGAWFLSGRALVPIQLTFARQQAFVADASHELRTPLAILRVAADLLYQRRHQPFSANETLLADLQQELARMERLAGDLLTLARSDLGQLALAVAEVDVASLAVDVARRALPLAAERRVGLTIEGGDESLPVEGDPDRLQQVFLIVLDNALKYTSAGGRVYVRAARRGHYALVEVQDTGPGIAADDVARVFDRFHRVDAARSTGGSGLGLAIADALVRAHDGKIELTSTPGAGTTVTIRLPALRLPTSIAARVSQLASRPGHRSAQEEHRTITN